MSIHVLIVPTEHFVTARYPLGGIFQLHQARALHRAGVRVGVVAPGVITSRFLLRRYPYDPFDDREGFPVLRRYVRKIYPSRWLRPSPGGGIYQDLGIQLYREYARRFGRPDVVHAHNFEYAGFVAQAIQRQTAVPYVVTEHSSLFLSGEGSGASSVALRACAGAAATVTAVSRALADSVARVVDAPVGVLPNVVDPSLLEAPIVRAPRDRSAPVFLSVGSLDANKNHAALIAAFAARFRGTGATLRIGGSGPLAGELRGLRSKLGVHDQVHLLGHLTRSQLRDELGAADCLVLPSMQETFGVVLIEALVHGVPVIATRCGGPQDIVTETSGMLVDVGDVAGLGDALVRMAAGRQDYSPEALRADCVARFGARAFVTRATELYRAALSVEHDPSSALPGSALRR